MAENYESYFRDQGEDYESYFRPVEPGTTPRVPAQERAVSLWERTQLQTIAPHDPAAKAAWLQKRGYNAQPTPSGQVAVEKLYAPGQWGVIDPTKPELMDLVDAADEIAFGIASGVGGAATAGAGPGGLLMSGVGAGVGGAAAESVRQALGAAAGFESTPGQVLEEVAIAGALGGVTEPLLRGAGRAGLAAYRAGRGALGKAGEAVGRFRGRGGAAAAPDMPAPRTPPQGFIGRGARAQEATIEPRAAEVPELALPEPTAADRDAIRQQGMRDLMDFADQSRGDIDDIVRLQRELESIPRGDMPGETIMGWTEPAEVAARGAPDELLPALRRERLPARQVSEELPALGAPDESLALPPPREAPRALPGPEPRGELPALGAPDELLALPREERAALPRPARPAPPETQYTGPGSGLGVEAVEKNRAAWLKWVDEMVRAGEFSPSDAARMRYGIERQYETRGPAMFRESAQSIYEPSEQGFARLSRWDERVAGMVREGRLSDEQGEQVRAFLRQTEIERGARKPRGELPESARLMPAEFGARGAAQSPEEIAARAAREATEGRRWQGERGLSREELEAQILENIRNPGRDVEYLRDAIEKELFDPVPEEGMPLYAALLKAGVGPNQARRMAMETSVEAPLAFRKTGPRMRPRYRPFRPRQAQAGGAPVSRQGPRELEGGAEFSPAQRPKSISGGRDLDWIDEAVEAGVMSAEEAQKLRVGIAPPREGSSAVPVELPERPRTMAGEILKEQAPEYYRPLKGRPAEGRPKASTDPRFRPAHPSKAKRFRKGSPPIYGGSGRPAGSPRAFLRDPDEEGWHQLYVGKTWVGEFDANADTLAATRLEEAINEMLELGAVDEELLKELYRKAGYTDPGAVKDFIRDIQKIAKAGAAPKLEFVRISDQEQRLELDGKPLGWFTPREMDSARAIKGTLDRALQYGRSLDVTDIDNLFRSYANAGFGRHEAARFISTAKGIVDSIRKAGAKKGSAPASPSPSTLPEPAVGWSKRPRTPQELTEQSGSALEKVRAGRFEIDTVEDLLRLPRSQEIREQVAQALDEAQEAGAADFMQAESFREWLKNIGFGDVRSRAPAAQPRAPARRQAGGIIRDTDAIGPRSPMVVSSSDGTLAVRWNGQEIGHFPNTREGTSQAVDFAGYLQEIERDLGMHDARIGAGVDDLLRASGHSEADIRAVDLWLKDAAKNLGEVHGEYASIVKSGRGEFEVTFEGDDIGATFHGPEGLQFAREVQEILEKVGSAGGQKGSSGEKARQGRYYEAARRELYHKLDEGNQWDAHGVLDQLDELIESPPEVDNYFDDVLDEYVVDFDNYHLGNYADESDATEVEYTVKEWLRVVRERDISGEEIDELGYLIDRSSDIEFDEAEELAQQLANWLEPPDWYWFIQSREKKPGGPDGPGLRGWPDKRQSGQALIPGGGGKKKGRTVSFRPTDQPELLRRLGKKAARGAGRAAVQTAMGVPTTAQAARIALRIASAMTEEAMKDAPPAAREAMKSIRRILSTSGRAAAHTAAYSMVQERREFERWLQKQQGSAE